MEGHHFTTNDNACLSGKGLHCGEAHKEKTAGRSSGDDIPKQRKRGEKNTVLISEKDSEL